MSNNKLELLHPKVAKAVTDYDLNVEVLECDPDFADTAAFNEKYGFAADEGANTIIIASRKVEPTQYAVCVVLPSTRLDVNKMVTKSMGVKRASFADSETTKQLTGMEIGGVVAVGIDDYPIYIDKAVLEQDKLVMGGGNRTSKLLMKSAELLKLPRVEVVEGLAKPVS